MTDTEMEIVGKLCDVLRAKGVTAWKGADCEITLGPLPMPDVKEAADAFRADAEGSADKCRCGCPMHAHVNGLCAHGCAIEACLEPKE
jgi:hypothetical protein